LDTGRPTLAIKRTSQTLAIRRTSTELRAIEKKNNNNVFDQLVPYGLESIFMND
jgi:hypothetical protein